PATASLTSWPGELPQDVGPPRRRAARTRYVNRMRASAGGLGGWGRGDSRAGHTPRGRGHAVPLPLPSVARMGRGVARVFPQTPAGAEVGPAVRRPPGHARGGARRPSSRASLEAVLHQVDAEVENFQRSWSRSNLPAFLISSCSRRNL